MDDPRHPIITVQIASSIAAQGPTVREVDLRRPGLPTDMHGKIAVAVGENTVAVGVPIQKMRDKT